VYALAAAVAAAEAAAVRASEACSAQAAACKQLQIEMHFLAEQQQCVASMQHTSAARAAAMVAPTAAVSAVADESDSDDDCPPLAHARAIVLCDNATSSTASVKSITLSTDIDAAEAAVVSTSENSCSISRSDYVSKRKRDSVYTKQQQQPKQSVQQPCVQCGRLTKKRCKRCQAVYYCSEECQIQCFKDTEHRAQC
jgi:MYND finger